MAAHRALPPGPRRVDAGHIAAEAGLTAGALVQRFGSKRDLILQLSARFSGGTGEMFAGCGSRTGRRWRRARLCRLHGRHGRAGGVRTQPLYLQIA